MGIETLTIGKALNLGLRRAMEDDAKVMLMGEDIGKLGGVFRITDGLQKDFGEDRVVDTPLAEAGILGTAVGLAMRGYRPVCEIQFDGFVFPAYNQIVTQVAKIHARSKGVLPMPIVIRIPFGGGIGAVEHHSESPEAYFAHTPGLKVVAVSNPVDAYWGIQQAIAHPDPIVFLEPKRRYWEKAEVDTDATPDPLFRSRVVRGGDDVTVLAYGPMVKTALQAAEAAAEEGRSLEVVDLRTVSPLDLDPVFESVRRTGRCVVVHEAAVTLGLGCRDRGPGDRELLPLAGGAGAARRRLRHPLPAVEAGRGVPARPGPGARRRRPLPGVLSMSSLRQFKLPDVGEGLTEGEILQWLVAVGDTVTVNQPLCEVETAKAAVELPSPYAGTVTELLFDAGTMVDVGTPIITIDVGGGAAAPAPAPPAAPASDEPAAGLIGGAAPGGRTAVLVGYGPRNTEARRRPRRSGDTVAARATAPVSTELPGADYGSGGQPHPPLLATAPDADTKPVRHGGLEVGRQAEAHALARRRGDCRRCRARSRGGPGRWPSRRCASTPRTSAST